VFNNGEMQRDFTYIDDIVEGLVRVKDQLPLVRKSGMTNAEAPYKIYNIGNNQPITLGRFIDAIEKATGNVAHRTPLPMQAGDVPITYANMDDLMTDVGFKPVTEIEEGIKRFVDWFVDRAGRHAEFPYPW
jgi:UDP-glucuronate 4-epimerase